MELRVENIKKLIGLLEEDVANPKGLRFDIKYLADSSPSDTPSLSWKPRIDCGTTACAMGLALISGAFESEGFGYIVSNGGMFYPRLDDRDIDYLDTAVILFGIDYRIAMRLFSPSYYLEKDGESSRGEKEVIARLKYLLEHGNLDVIVAAGFSNYVMLSDADQGETEGLDLG